MRFRYFSVLAFSFLFTPDLYAVTGEDFEFHGYLRSGTRAYEEETSRCYKNKGPAGGINEFRLGNECETYGELGFTAHQQKGIDEEAPFFKTHIMTSFSTAGNTQYETHTPALAQAYVEGGNHGETKIKYWVGKRFYRDASVHMNDDFYFANTNGNGAGVFDLKFLPTGKLALAYFLEQTNPTPPANVTTRYKGHFADLRWFDIRLTETHFLDFWSMYGFTPGGTLTTSAGTTQYSDTSGFALGLKHKFHISGLKNDLSLQYGARLLQGLGMANVANDQLGGGVRQSRRLRVVNDLIFEPDHNWSIELAGRYEKFSRNPSSDSGTWWSAGVRPIYNFSSPFAIATEFGYSSVKYTSDTKASTLGRATVAPTLRPNVKYFARPELRAFYTTSFRYGDAFGVQGEVWF